jgi:hypothetical protein
MGKQPKKGVYQYDAFQEMAVIKELRAEIAHLHRQALFYENAWSDEKRKEVAARIRECQDTINMLK